MIAFLYQRSSMDIAGGTCKSRDRQRGWQDATLDATGQDMPFRSCTDSDGSHERRQVDWPFDRAMLRWRCPADGATAPTSFNQDGEKAFDCGPPSARPAGWNRPNKRRGRVVPAPPVLKKCRQPTCRASVILPHADPDDASTPECELSFSADIRALLPCLPALCAFACSSTDLVVGAPTPPKCQVAVDNSLPTAPAAGAAGTLTVTTTPECEWDATTATSWIAITSPSHNQGSGAVTYRVAENADASARGGTVSINSTQVAINQAAGACRFTVAPLASSVAATGGSVEVRVDAQATCLWEAASQVSWIRVGSSASHTGVGTVTLTIDPNAGGSRSGSVVIAGQTMTVRQADAANPTCVFQVTPDAIAIPAVGGHGDVHRDDHRRLYLGRDVGPHPGSRRRAQQVMVPARFSCGLPRMQVACVLGTVTIGGQTLTVTQAAAVRPAVRVFRVGDHGLGAGDGGTP